MVKIIKIIIKEKNEDMEEMMMEEGIDEEGNIDIEIEDLKMKVKIGEEIGNEMRKGNGEWIGKREIIKKGERNDIGDEKGMGCKK